MFVYTLSSELLGWESWLPHGNYIPSTGDNLKPQTSSLGIMAFLRENRIQMPLMWARRELTFACIVWCNRSYPFAWPEAMKLHSKPECTVMHIVIHWVKNSRFKYHHAKTWQLNHKLLQIARETVHLLGDSVLSLRWLLGSLHSHRGTHDFQCNMSLQNCFNCLALQRRQIVYPSYS